MATRALATRTRTIIQRVKSRRSAKRKITVPLAVIAGAAPFVTNVIGGFKFAGFTGALNNAAKVTGYDGYNKQWNMRNFKESGAPQLLVGMLVHQAANKLGFNRMLGNIGVPYIRI